MIRAFHLPKYSQQKVETLKEISNLDNATWIDLQEPSAEQIREVEEYFDISFPTRQEQEEIESSSRYLEESGSIMVNSTFLNLVPRTGKLEENEISFIITDKVLFTLRYFESKVIYETVKKVKQSPFSYINPSRIFMAILESRIDFDADLIESVSKHISDINKKINYSDHDLEEDIIIKISKCQELTMSLREALFDKQRVVTYLARNEDLMNDNQGRLKIIIKDVNSLIEHTNFSFTRLEYLQNNFLGLINIQQNKAIKMFTIASLTFMPPTLIASMYGMNFKFMPELNWIGGYPIAVTLMLASSLITLYVFKRKKWI